MSDNNELYTVTITWDGEDYKLLMPKESTIADAVAVLRKQYPHLATKADNYEGFTTFEEVVESEPVAEDDAPLPWPLDPGP